MKRHLSKFLIIFSFYQYYDDIQMKSDKMVTIGWQYAFKFKDFFNYFSNLFPKIAVPILMCVAPK